MREWNQQAMREAGTTEMLALLKKRSVLGLMIASPRRSGGGERNGTVPMIGENGKFWALERWARCWVLFRAPMGSRKEKKYSERAPLLPRCAYPDCPCRPRSGRRCGIELWGCVRVLLSEQQELRMESASEERERGRHPKHCSNGSVLGQMIASSRCTTAGGTGSVPGMV